MSYYAWGERRERKHQETSQPMIAVLVFIFIISAFLGFELISKVPSQLHTPLMSGSNAISGITIVGAIVVAGAASGEFATALGFLAVIFAMINVVGGYLVTDRMLAMFKKKKKSRAMEWLYIIAASLF